PLLLVGWRLVHLHLYCVALNSHRVGTDLDFRAVRPDAIAQAEAPGVPGASDRASLDVAAAERGAHVRAGIVDGVILPLVVEDGDEVAADRDGLAFAIGQLAYPAHRPPFACGDTILLRIIGHTSLVRTSETRQNS